MAQQTDIEIKTASATEVVISTKKTLYVCVYWNGNGTMFANMPTDEKKYQEQYALSMSKSAEHTCIYKFDIDVPTTFKNK